MHAIKQNIYWTGYVDWDLRNFHGYETPIGSTYNAYLIVDEKPTLIDTVKHYGCEEMLGRIREIMDPAEIRYIISNHTEMDHSGSIDRMLSLCPNAEVVCSPKGAEGLKRHFKKDWPLKVVQSGDTLNIGKRTLQFLLMPMVHWPDSMATYSEQDRILFPNDAFGQHYASEKRFVDEVGVDIALSEAAKYYANIVLPYGNQVLKVLDAVSSLKVDMIGPSHGLIWREPEHIQKIVTSYQKWASHTTDPRVVIVYDTMWHSTERMAQRLYTTLDRKGIPVKMMHLSQTHISDVVTDVMRSRVVCFGTPILNNRMLPTMAALLMYLKGLKPKDRTAFTFGSYGWATVGFKEFEASIQDAGMRLTQEGAYVRFVPDESDLQAFDAVAERIQGALGP
jgi:flavorubredoxin